MVYRQIQRSRENKNLRLMIGRLLFFLHQALQIFLTLPQTFENMCGDERLNFRSNGVSVQYGPAAASDMFSPHLSHPGCGD